MCITERHSRDKTMWERWHIPEMDEVVGRQMQATDDAESYSRWL